MTVAAINNELEIQTAIHVAARQMVELMQAAVKRVKELGGDHEAAEARILELVAEE